VNRAHGDDPRHSAPAAEEAHALPLDLALEAWHDAPGCPAECEPPVVTDAAHDEARLAHRAGHQPAPLSAPEDDDGVAGAIPRGARKQRHDRVDQALLVARHRGHRREAGGQLGKIGSPRLAADRSRRG
jgi:hypothetical protein